jgi:type 1 glutamine amidotransferase/sugar phosphate isomerase/epimerase
MTNPFHSFPRRQFLRHAMTASLLAPAVVPRAIARGASPGAAGETEKIEAALPARAPAPCRKPRKLLIFTLNVGYGGHPSINTANQAFTLMGRKTGAFETVISQDPAVFQRASLAQFDAVFFNNTVGNCFRDAALRENLAEFVYGGGGLMGVHGTSVAFTQWPGAIEDWPEFGLMLAARGANHKASDEHVFIRLDDPGHPVNQVFGRESFDYRDEFFRVHEPYSRKRARVLLSIDTEKTDLGQGPSYGQLLRPDNDYALAWVRQYGRGRVFYCTIAHNPRVFWDPRLLQFYLAAAQFALGDLPAPTTPSARLTPALRAQERLGWRLGLPARVFPQDTLFELIDRAEPLGLLHLEGHDQLVVSSEIDRPLDHRLDADQRRAIRLKLDARGVRLLAYQVQSAPADNEAWRQVFEFARRMGIETLIADPHPETLGTLAKLCDEYDLRLALRQGVGKDAARQAQPEEMLKLCRDRSERLGVCGNMASWMRAGIAPLEAIKALQGRLLMLQVHDLNERTPQGHDVPWGAGAGQLAGCLAELRRLGLTPTMFGVDGQASGASLVSELTHNIKFFNQTSLDLAGGLER